MKRWARLPLGLAVAGGLLWLLFRRTDWAEVGEAIRGMQAGWFALSQLLLWGTHFCRVERWSYVVRAVHPASFRQLQSATQIGFLVNFSAPARLGELVRALLLTRLAGPPISRSLAMVALDRMTDLIGLLAVLLVAALALTRDRDVAFAPGTFGNAEPLVVSSALLRPAGLALAGLVLALLAGLVALYVWREPMVRAVRAVFAPLSARLARRAASLLEGFAEGMHIFRSGWDLARALLWSLVTWVVDLTALAAILAAFGVDFPWHAPFLVLALIAAAIAIPVAPGVVGQYHLPAVAGLLMAVPELSPDRAKAVAIVGHLSTLAPIAGLGLWCLWRERLGLSDVLRRARAEDGASAGVSG